VTLLYIIQAVIGFGVLVFVHELGHFLAAKWIKVRVEAFSLGFGPFIKYKRGETEYRLSAIPLGGYVKMAGEEPEPGRAPAPDEFYSKSVGQRALVFVAGVTLNLISGFIFFIIAYGFGVPVIPAVVGEVNPGSPAWKAGLQRGDRIVEIDDISPPVDFEDLTTSSILAGSDKKVRLRVRRGEETHEFIIEPQYIKEVGRKSMGIGPALSMTLAPSDDIPRSRSGDGDLMLVYRAGMVGGDTIKAVRVQGSAEVVPVASPFEFILAVDQCAGQPVYVYYTRAGDKPGAPWRSARVRPETSRERMIGVKFGSARVDAVRPGSWAEKMGFQDGDEILSVGGTAVKCRADAVAQFAASRTAETPVVVKRAGASVTLTLSGTPRARNEVEQVLVFDPGYVVDGLMPGYPAERAGIQAGDVLTSVDGDPLKKPGQLADAVYFSGGKALKLAWERDGKTMEADIQAQARWQIVLPLESSHETVRAGLVESLRLGLRKTWQWVGRIYVTIARLISGDVSVKNVNGPISIGYIVYSAAGQGMGMLLYFLGILSINLAVFNLLPIPVLDGGHLLFALIEKLRGKVVNDRVREIATYCGYGLILGLLVIAFWNDIKMFIFKWM
jgi:regulator of sigma E protease